MLDKTKWEPKTPPEPVITGSLAPQPKKKRGRKRTKKRYFTEDTDLAIKQYLASSNQEERDNIFKTRIHYPFYKLAENLIHTFKFYYTEVDDLEDLKHEVCCFFLEKLDYFKPEKGTKAFSYFSIVGKNYLILYNNNNYKKKKIKADPLAADEDSGVIRSLGRDQRKKDLKDFIVKQGEAIEACDQRLKQIDNKGIFYADDQIGFFFKEVQKIQEALNEFTLK